MDAAELAELRDFLTAVRDVLTLPPADPADERADRRRDWELSARVASVRAMAGSALAHETDPGLRFRAAALRHVAESPLPYAVAVPDAAERQDQAAEAEAGQ
jgi:hypothetical protein